MGPELLEQLHDLATGLGALVVVVEPRQVVGVVLGSVPAGAQRGDDAAMCDLVEAGEHLGE